MQRIVNIPTAGISQAMEADTIGFVKLKVRDRVEDAIGAGSGTLVSIGKVYGILTGAHVLAHLPDIREVDDSMECVTEVKRIRNSVAVRSGFGVVSRHDGESAEPGDGIAPISVQSGRSKKANVKAEFPLKF